MSSSIAKLAGGDNVCLTIVSPLVARNKVLCCAAKALRLLSRHSVPPDEQLGIAFPHRQSAIVTKPPLAGSGTGSCIRQCYCRQQVSLTSFLNQKRYCRKDRLENRRTGREDRSAREEVGRSSQGWPYPENTGSCVSALYEANLRVQTGTAVAMGGRLQG